ncbi:5584_t:CDS:2 [Ambispora leptoticha]|uniref:5584_t:CDS:1 n=1 Tax=Ambispora leptoticha TaxID=144679 RepID=A0A9N8VPE4_9GLOM|nr:5584_t:CDS:2 [Ambispora leptoticha]
MIKRMVQLYKKYCTILGFTILNIISYSGFREIGIRYVRISKCWEFRDKYWRFGIILDALWRVGIVVAGMLDGIHHIKARKFMTYTVRYQNLWLKK